MSLPGPYLDSYGSNPFQMWAGLTGPHLLALVKTKWAQGEQFLWAPYGSLVLSHPWPICVLFSPYMMISTSILVSALTFNSLAIWWVQYLPTSVV